MPPWHSPPRAPVSRRRAGLAVGACTHGEGGSTAMRDRYEEEEKEDDEVVVVVVVGGVHEEKPGVQYRDDHRRNR